MIKKRTSTSEKAIAIFDEGCDKRVSKDNIKNCLTCDQFDTCFQESTNRAIENAVESVMDSVVEGVWDGIDRRTLDRGFGERKIFSDKKRAADLEDKVNNFSFINTKVILTAIPIIASIIGFSFHMFEKFKDNEFKTNSNLEKIVELQKQSEQNAKALKDIDDHLNSIEETIIQIIRSKK